MDREKITKALKSLTEDNFPVVHLGVHSTAFVNIYFREIVDLLESVLGEDEKSPQWTTLKEQNDNLAAVIQQQLKAIKVLHNKNAQLRERLAGVYSAKLDNQRASIAVLQGDKDKLERENEALNKLTDDQYETIGKLRECLERINGNSKVIIANCEEGIDIA